jgi:hypothetical protein
MARIPKVGDKVTVPRSELVYTIWQVYEDGEVNLHVPGFNLDRYRVPVRDLRWVEEE